MIDLVDVLNTGEDLLRLTAGLARATRGRFTGPAAVALATATTFSQAALGGFLALASLPEMTEPQRMACGLAARAFRDGLGTIASNFAGGDVVTSLASLGVMDPSKPAPLDDFFVDETPLVLVSLAARDAMDVLRRDPIELASFGRAAIEDLLLTVVVGVVVTS
jgi:hypothetical protein